MLKEEKKRIKILLIGSNYKGLKESRIGKEIKMIRNILKHSLFDFIDAPATKRNEIFEKISEYKPEILQFSGHGTFNTGPLFDQDEHLINTKMDLKEELIETLRKGKEYIKIIIFNVCESINIAKEASKFIEFTIGTTTKINDDCAITFSKGFYKMLGKKHSIRDSYFNGKKQYELKYSNIIGRSTLPPFKIFPDNEKNQGDFSEIFQISLDKNWKENNKIHSDKYVDNNTIESILKKRLDEFEHLIFKNQQRKNQFDMKIAIFPQNNLFNISKLEDLKIFFNEQQNLIPAPDYTYDTMSIYDNLRIDNHRLYDISRIFSMGSSIRISKEGIILYNMHINIDKNFEKRLQISYMSAYILGLLNLSYRFFNLKMNYSRNIEIRFKINQINNWYYSLPGEIKTLKSYQYNSFSPIVLTIKINQIRNGTGQYGILKEIIRELMRGYECSQDHQMPDLSDFRNFLMDDRNDFFDY